MNRDFEGLRRDYAGRALVEADAPSDPMDLFASWFREAMESEPSEPNGMVLATADAAGRPSARVVLLKAYDDRGFVYFTNWKSRKGQEGAPGRPVALDFWWRSSDRQVRIEGLVEAIADAESDAYFQKRPLDSRLGAWASPQSEVLADRAELEQRFAEAQQRFGEAGPPRPAHWGGLRVVPSRIEFWQGRANRLHDRLAYSRDADGSWSRVRLAP